MQIFALIFAGWLIKWSYAANMRARAHPPRAKIGSVEDFKEIFDAYGYAFGFFTGFAIIIFILAKFFTD